MRADAHGLYFLGSLDDFYFTLIVQAARRRGRGARAYAACAPLHA